VVIFSLLLFAIGIAALVKSSTVLVDGASSIADKFRISPMVIGLTIVAFGTSAPELLVSVTSALSGSTDIALGNVVGSNIFNILVILGLSALIFPLHIQRNTVWKEIPFSLLAALLVFFFGAAIFINNGTPINLNGSEIVGYLNRNYGMVLLSFFLIFLAYVFGISRNKKEDTDVEIHKRPVWQSVLMVIGGLIGLSLSAKYLVTNPAINIAQVLGISETVIGLTLVAVGTSLPELATSITASIKKNSDIAIGNIVGSNIFNILLILGITLIIRPVPMTGQNLFDLLFLLFATIILFILIFVFQKYRLNKIEGIIMLGLYIFYTIFLFVR
jgi:cation:H+ antiporter